MVTSTEGLNMPEEVKLEEIPYSVRMALIASVLAREIINKIAITVPVLLYSAPVSPSLHQHITHPS